MKNTGKEYEKLAHAIFSAALGLQGLENSEIIHDVDLPGKTRDAAGNPITHQIDVYWKFDIGGVTYQAIVQAKDWKSRVTKEKVLAFKSVLDDLPGQPRGIMVTSVGYQAGAQLYAQEHGIDLYVLQNLDPRVPRSITIEGVGAHYDTSFADIDLSFESTWLSKNKEKVPELLHVMNPEQAVIYGWDGSEVGPPLRPFISAFENIRNTAVMTGTSGVILNWFDEPVAVKSPEMPEPIVLHGVSARLVVSNEEPENLNLDLSKLFSFIIRKVTGNKTYLVDQDFALHDETFEKAMCDFCLVPVPDDDSNLFFAKRVLAVFKGGDDELGYPQVFEASNWGACDPCAKLIREGNRQALFDRAAKMMKLAFSNDRHMGLKAAHSAFWLGYAGLEPADYDKLADSDT